MHMYLATNHKTTQQHSNTTPCPVFIKHLLQVGNQSLLTDVYLVLLFFGNYVLFYYDFQYVFNTRMHCPTNILTSYLVLLLGQGVKVFPQLS